MCKGPAVAVHGRGISEGIVIRTGTVARIVLGSSRIDTVQGKLVKSLFHAVPLGNSFVYVASGSGLGGV
jgi:hypothetical protein